ncbi:hypothetical protein SMF913_25289 [Streptomyces malaysiensis]|uniref:Uncharacterized protein n=1 Tax=Streptomyces malaysiensis TaxID=92644 RepID=A0A2J7YP76_STRMQ|nr:hypothetical protein SMF913_25289 [Streptomyces malaysiensis]
MPGRRCGRGAFVGELHAHPVKDTFGDGEFVPLGPRLHQLFGQRFFEFVRFRTARGDPFQQFGIQHASDRRRPSDRHGKERADRPQPLPTRSPH